IAGPIYAALLPFAGGDMLRDLVTFPLTDFRFARPERYPEPLPNPDSMASAARTIQEISFRLTHWLPAIVALASAICLLWERRRATADRFAAQTLLTLCFPFFWNAAHVQIN